MDVYNEPSIKTGLTYILVLSEVVIVPPCWDIYWEFFLRLLRHPCWVLALSSLILSLTIGVQIDSKSYILQGGSNYPF